MVNNGVMKLLFVVALVVLLFYLGKYCSMDVEGFEDEGQSEQVVDNNVESNNTPEDPQQDVGVVPSQDGSSTSQFATVGDGAGQYNSPMKKLKQDCFPKDQLDPSELLPNKADVNEFDASNPKAVGELSDQNFLDAGYHVGVNTVGQSLRNANLQIRSEPANPQTKISPWLNSTIGPDTNQRPFEVGASSTDVPLQVEGYES
jgi:hypothetical protein